MPKAICYKNQRTVNVSFINGNQSGFSLLEVLISIIILSFGLLGMVGLQAAALQANRDARLQSSAVSLARELAEMMRNNKDVALLPAGNNPYLNTFNTNPLVATLPSYCLDVASNTTPCIDNTDVANAQMTDWLARVSAELPSPKVVVCVDSQPFANGLPTWACSPGGTGTTTAIKIGWTRTSTDKSKNGVQALEQATVPSIVFPVIPGNT